MNRRQQLRRSFERWSLRFQARLDSPSSDRVIPWILAAINFIILAGLSLSQYRSFDNGTELARYVQAAWKLGEGIDPGVGVDGTHFLAQQAAVGFLPLGWLLQFVPIGPSLLVIQSAFLAIGVVPLWRIARNQANLRVGATLTLCFAYMFYPALHNINLADFHLESVAPAGLLGAIHFAKSERWWRFGLLVVVVLSARADLSLAIVGLGVLVALDGHRRAGLLTALSGAAWLIGAFVIVELVAGEGIYPHVDAFERWGDTPWGSLWGLITQPLDVIEVLFSRQSFDRVVFLLAPLLFLPMVAPRYVLPVIPLEALYLLSDIGEDRFGHPEQDMAPLPFLFVAAAFALSQAGRIRGKRTLIDPRVLGAIVLTVLVFFVRDSISSPYQRPWSWSRRDVSDIALIQAVNELPEDALVRASSSVLPQVAERRRVFELDTSDEFVRSEAAAEGVNVIVLDLAQAPEWGIAQVLDFAEGLAPLGFDQSSAADNIFVFKRTRLPS